MELDDLQKTWRSLNNAPNQNETVDNNALRHILQTRSKTKGVLDELRGRVIKDAWINGITAIALFVGLVLEDFFPMRLVFGGLFLYEVFMGYYFFKKLQLLHKLASPDESLRSYLANLTMQLKNFLRVYKYGNVLMMPFALFAGLFIGTYYTNRTTVLARITQNPSDVLMKVGAIVLICVVSFYFFIDWWTKMWYGGHVRRLEEYTKELED